MLNSLEQTTQGWDIETIALVDEHEETKEIAEKHCTLVNFSPEMRGVGYRWNLGLSLSHGDIIMPGMDDLLFHAEWLDYAMESREHKLNGYGVVGMNDLAYDGNVQLAITYLVDRQFCKDHLGGVLHQPVYNYYCADSEINAIAKSLGKFFWDKRSIVEHLHPAHRKRPEDELDRRKGDTTEDNRIFEERKARGFPITWSPII
jgi:hypothetical protein